MDDSNRNNRYKYTYNYNAALRLLTALLPAHPDYLQAALDTLGLDYRPPQEPAADSAADKTKKPAIPAGDIVEPPTPAAADFAFELMLVSQQQSVSANDSDKSLEHEWQDVAPLVFDSSAQQSGGSVLEATPLWHEKPLYRALQPFLYHEKISPQPDIDKITRQFARKQPLVKLPRQQSKHFPPEIWLYCDYSDGAAVYHDDYQRLEQWLKNWFGESVVSQNIRLLPLQRAKQGQSQVQGAYRWRPSGLSTGSGLSTRSPGFNALSPPAGVLVLLLAADLAWQKAPWQQLSRHLRAANSRVIYLSAGSLTPQLSIPVINSQAQAIAGQQLDKLLLALSLSPSVITLALLRQLRIELIGGTAALEARITTDENIHWYQSSNSGFWHSGDDAAAYQQRVKNQLSAAEQQLAHQIIAEHLEAENKCWLRQHQLLCRLFCPDLSADSKTTLDKEIKHYFDAFGKRLLTQENPHEVEWLMIQGRTLGTKLAQLPSPVNKAFTLSNMLWRKLSGSDEQLPGVDPRLWQTWYQSSETELQPGRIVQQVSENAIEWHICPADAPLDCGVEIARVADLTSLLVQPPSARQKARQKAIQRAGQGDRLLVAEHGPLTLTDRLQTLTLQTLSSEAFYWADELSVSAAGVVASTDFIRVSWPAPGQGQEQAQGQQGYLGAIIELTDDAPPWLQHYPPQLDERGLFVEISLAGNKDAEAVAFRVRYIPGGSFLMGSPPDEPKREDNETRHPVGLTQGFWLGETTVTQQLWQAVMGKNPSHFEAEPDEALPVEQVSWGDCQQFCQQLNQQLKQQLKQKAPGLTATLPTEAQWEYACRAGTPTPFSTGQQLSTAQANYDGNFPYHNGAEGEYREKTVAVDTFDPNPWGVYQMHGNVLEWCQDGQREYQSQIELNPIAETQIGRVLRGGCWIGSGRICRSAYRSGGAHDGIFVDFGLRVTLVNEFFSERAARAVPSRSGARPGKGEARERRDEAFSAQRLHQTQAITPNTSNTHHLNWLDLAEIDNRIRWQRRPPKSFPSPWACQWGFDQYGLWQSFAVKTALKDKHKTIYCKMRYIPPGTFLMGSPPDEPDRRDNETQHPVTLSQGFWLGETTVTQQLWQAVMGNNPSKFTSKTGQLPVEKVSWDDCQQFCKDLAQKVPGLTPSLPSEAQWEYACRAGTQTPFATGKQLTPEQANYEGNKGQTVAVDKFPPNLWGLYQMHGNVWEWCRDDRRTYRAEPETDPMGGTDSPLRVLRGGSWFDFGPLCRSAFRYGYAHDSIFDFIGLRVTQV